jgi:hypothetical protein
MKNLKLLLLQDWIFKIEEISDLEMEYSESDPDSEFELSQNILILKMKKKDENSIY